MKQRIKNVTQAIEVTTPEETSLVDKHIITITIITAMTTNIMEEATHEVKRTTEQAEKAIKTTIGPEEAPTQRQQRRRV